MIETDDLFQQRLNKLTKIRDLGIEPYPARFPRTHTAAEALRLYETLPDHTDSAEMSLTGRLVSSRIMGKIIFAHIRDGTGRIQIYLKRDILGDERFEFYKLLDIGDFVGVSGNLFRTKTGEITLEVHNLTLLSKAMRSLPEKWHGLVDVEKRYRQRYLDLISNDEARATFVMRSKMVTSLRRFMDSRGFIEVETPVLQAHAGGAMAKPFITHYNALDHDFFLRIATELHLKQLIIGGLEKVYEIGRIFRNEGLSTKHNPEFTTMESYEAYADYDDVMNMVEGLVGTLARETAGTTEINYGAHTIDLSPPWPRITLRDAILEKTGIDFSQFPTTDSLRHEMHARGYRTDSTMGRGKLIDELLSAAVEPTLIQPTFLVDYPIELSPLAKKKTGNPDLVERFEAFAAGMEIANAFTELNDPLDQRERFQQQLLQRQAGDEEADIMDEDFIVAMEHGMPPAGGLGVGIDRLAMLLTDNQSIREVILFPQLRVRD